ncbi:MAG: hypothetical protein ABJD11_04380 [Gemmatimonadota bacterium]
MTGHLLHVGYPKAASHLLRRWFTDHPQLAYEESGIGGYRDVFQISRESAIPRREILYRVTSSETFTAPTRDTGKPAERFVRSRWVGVRARQSAVCELLAGLFPASRVLLVTRGFRSMIVSSYSEMLRSGAGIDFPDFCAVIRDAMLAVDAPWDYDDVIRLYRNAFGADRVTVLPVELLRDNADGFIRAIETPLGLEHCPATTERLHRSLSAVEMYWYPKLIRSMHRVSSARPYLRLCARAVLENRFRPLIALLQRTRPGRPVTLESVPEELMATFCGKAVSLKDDPLYAPYAGDYLF